MKSKKLQEKLRILELMKEYNKLFDKSLQSIFNF